jgi:hypothetical protein
LEKLWSGWAAHTATRVRTAGGEPIYRHLADAQEKFVGGGSDSGDVEMRKPAPGKKNKKAATPQL